MMTMMIIITTNSLCTITPVVLLSLEAFISPASYFLPHMPLFHSVAIF
jgi:hypothetical protein